MIKHSCFITLLLLSLSVIGRAEALTRRFVVELQSDSDSPYLSFSLKPGRHHTSSGNPSDIADASRFAGSDLPPDDKRHYPYDYGIKTTIIESISWQWLYATKLLIAYEMILRTQDTPLNSNLYSWPPVEAFITVGLLLKSYWNPDSPLFNPMGQQEAASMLTQGEYPFVINTMASGSGADQQYDQQQGQPPASSDQQASGTVSVTTTRLGGTITSHLHSDSGDGNGDPEHQQHTFGLHCLADNCNGVCKFRQSGARPKQWSRLNEGSDGQSAASRKVRFSFSLTRLPPNSLPAATAQAMPVYQNRDNTGQQTCHRIVVGPNGRLMLCGTICQNTQILTDHKRRFHQKTCYETMIGPNGQLRRCGMVFQNAKTMTDHKRRCHPGQRFCDVTVVRQDGQQRPCAKAFPNGQSLSIHKSRYHRHCCDVIVVWPDNQQRPCGRGFRSAQDLMTHKRTHQRLGPIALKRLRAIKKAFFISRQK
ncbi:hypothetical protein [Endozoicomonas sp. 8E]|uniref:hypothetical protein n=1 Tax=Endozoicomonas sp. 8E TaxID=3035692 RepID=UPI002938D3A7|nr:hypothetical protein [Endozoicomonas sp. 8E]WOG26840.1 hypothetical protein P6910_20170 [Endozoicomonas sp. 8E]